MAQLRGLERTFHVANDKVRGEEGSLSFQAPVGTLETVVAELGHQLNQPLHAIVNFAEAGRNVLAGPSGGSHAMVLDWLKQISEQAIRATHIVQQARQLARRVPQRQAAVNVNELMRDSLALVNANLQEQKVRLAVVFSEKLPSAAIDAVQMTVLLVNLLHSAVEALTDNGLDDRELLVSTAAVDKFVQISVRHNGVHRPLASTHPCLMPFQSPQLLATKVDWTLLQSLVGSHGGRLWAEPNSDGGATYYLNLPSLQE